MNNPYDKTGKKISDAQKALEAKEAAFVNKPLTQYDAPPAIQPKEETEPAIRFSIYIPAHVYNRINLEVLPSIYGTKKNKNGRPLKATLADYFRELAIADLAKRDAEEGEHGKK